MALAALQDPDEAEDTGTPKYQELSASAACAAGPSMVYLSEPEDETLSTLSAFIDELPQPSWDANAEEASLLKIHGPRSRWQVFLRCTQVFPKLYEVCNEPLRQPRANTLR